MSLHHSKLLVQRHRPVGHHSRHFSRSDPNISMKKLLPLSAKAIAALTIAITAVGAHAQTKPGAVYGEIGLTQITYKEDGTSIKPSVLRALVGTEVAPNIAVEGMFGFGVKDDTTRVGNVNVKGEIDHTWGVFVKPKVVLAPNLEAFARFGYARTKLAASIPGRRITESGGDLAYGIGVAYKLSDKVSANVDYMSYYDKNDIKATGFTFGVGMRF